MRRPIFSIAAVGAALWAATTFADSSKPTVLRFRLPFEPPTLDWTQGDVPITVIQNAMRGLFRVDEKGDVVPDLVKKTETRLAGRKWIFHLKPGIYWSDGVPFKAQHAVDGLMRLLDPKTGSTYTYFLYDVVGSRPGEKGPPAIRATSDLDIEVLLRKPVAFLPAILTHWVTYPVRKELSAQKGYGTQPDKMAYLGSFAITDWQRSSKIIMKANPRAELKPRLNGLEAIIVTDDSTALNLYDAGKLDFLTDLPAHTKKTDAIRDYPSPILYFIGISPTHPLTKSRDGVAALSAALDRSQIPAVLDAPHRPAATLCPPEILKTKAPTIEDLNGNPDHARALLKKAGFASPDLVPPLTLRYFNRPFIKQIAEWIQGQWKAKLGIRVELEGQDPKTYWTQLAKTPSELFLNSKGASYPDADAFFRLFSSDNPQNLGHWSDKDYDGLIDRAASLLMTNQRTARYEKALSVLLGKHPALIPLYFRNTQYLIRPSLEGVRINSLTSVDFSEAAFR